MWSVAGHDSAVDALDRSLREGRLSHAYLVTGPPQIGKGRLALDFAKALIDEGFHPMTVYFPLVVSGAMLVEPTESESKQSLDQFIGAIRSLADAAKSGDGARFTSAPRFAPRKRLDETRAARDPILTYREPLPRAAE